MKSTFLPGRTEAGRSESGGGASLGADGLAARIPSMESEHAGGAPALQQRRRARTRQSQVRASSVSLWSLGMSQDDIAIGFR